MENLLKNIEAVQNGFIQLINEGEFTIKRLSEHSITIDVKGYEFFLVLYTDEIATYENSYSFVALRLNKVESDLFREKIEVLRQQAAEREAKVNELRREIQTIHKAIEEIQTAPFESITSMEVFEDLP